MASRACHGYLSMLTDISTLLKSFAVIVLTISPGLGDPAIATDSYMPIDQEINVSTDTPNNYLNLNGTTFELMELDILCRGSCWEPYITEDGLRLRHKRSKASINRHLLWNDGKVPYKLDATFSANDKKNLIRAMNEYKKYTCIEFHEANSSNTDYVRIVERQDCFSELGRQQGGQMLSLNRHCRKIPVMLHELGHAIGLWHEHSRPDRDDYIKINRSNITPKNNKDFEKLDWGESYNSGIEYDFWSIMHYRDNEASHDGKHRVITTKDQRYQNIIGRQKGLSFRDVKLINMLYNCSKRNGCPEISCRGEGFVGQDCNCWCPSANISTSSVHCNESNALVNVGDILKKELNMSNTTEESELRSTEENNKTVQLNSYYILPSKHLLYIKGEDSGYEKLSLLMLLADFLNKYTCRQFLVEMHIDGNRKIVDANGISSYLKSNDGDKYRSWAKSCITIAEGGFITQRRMTSAEELGTIDCVDSYATVSDSFLLKFKSVVFWWSSDRTHSDSLIGPWMSYYGTIISILSTMIINSFFGQVFRPVEVHDISPEFFAMWLRRRRAIRNNAPSSVMVQAETAAPEATNDVTTALITPRAAGTVPIATTTLPDLQINEEDASIPQTSRWVLAVYIILSSVIVLFIAAPLLILFGRWLCIILLSLQGLAVLFTGLIKITNKRPFVTEVLNDPILKRMFTWTLLTGFGYRRKRLRELIYLKSLFNAWVLLSISVSSVFCSIMYTLCHKQSNVVTLYWEYQNLTSVSPDLLHNGTSEVNEGFGCADRSRCSLLVACPVGLLAEDCQYWCPPEDSSHAAILTGDQWINQLLSTFVTEALFAI